MKALETERFISFKSILYPTDFSPVSEAALPFVLVLAGMHGSRVTVAHVRMQDSEALLPPLSSPHRKESADDPIQRGMGSLEDKLKALEHEFLVGEGEIWEFLASVIRDLGIDLVVIGTQGRTGLGKFMLGSVAEIVFRQAICPVLTIGPHVVRSSAHGWEMANVLLPTDFTPESLAAWPLAFALARERHARLTLLNVLERRRGPEDLVDRQRYVESTVRTLQDQVPFGLSESCGLTYEVTEGAPAEEILRVAKERDCDLIVLGVRSAPERLSLAAHLSGPTAHRVAAKAPCPVLTLCG